MRKRTKGKKWGKKETKKMRNKNERKNDKKNLKNENKTKEKEKNKNEKKEQNQQHYKNTEKISLTVGPAVRSPKSASWALWTKSCTQPGSYKGFL